MDAQILETFHVVKVTDDVKKKPCANEENIRYGFFRLFGTLLVKVVCFQTKIKSLPHNPNSKRP